MKFYRNLFLLAGFCLTLSAFGCSSDAPATASGDPVPVDYEENQQAAQQKAMEEAMKNRGKRR